MGHSSLAAALVAVVAVVSACAQPGGPERGVGAPVFVVERGPLSQSLLLTGVLDAAHSVELSVPRTDDWNLGIRWLAEDGAIVAEGDKVVEFENAATISRIVELELTAAQADSDLAKDAADTAVAVAEKEFAVVTQQVAVAKAKLDTEVPETLMSRREHQQAKLELARAKAAHTTAREDRDGAVEGGRLGAQIRRIALDKAMRAYRAAELQLDELSLTAPRGGMFSVGTQPREARKLQVGDNVWPGLSVGKLPDLSAMIVEGSVSDVDDGRVQPGMRVQCTVDAYADRPLEGTVAALSPVAHASAQDSLRRFFALVVDLDAADPEIARPGLSVKIEVLTRTEDDVLLVPRAALDRSQTPARARLVGGRWVEVEIDFCTAQACAVASGLTEGDRLVAAKERP